LDASSNKLVNATISGASTNSVITNNIEKYIGPSTSDGNASLIVFGDAVVFGAMTIKLSVNAPQYNTTSDYRIKTNVVSLDSDFNVDKLRPVRYLNTLTNKQDIGLIAHELQAIYPYLVSGEKDETNLQSVNYIGIIAILIKEIQTLKSTVIYLQNQIDKITLTVPR
jgi:hypothetical protein